MTERTLCAAEAAIERKHGTLVSPTFIAVERMFDQFIEMLSAPATERRDGEDEDGERWDGQS